MLKKSKVTKILALCLIVFMLFELLSLKMYRATSVEQAISNGAFGRIEDAEEIIFEYENKDAVIVFYKGRVDEYKAILSKRKLLGTAKYLNKETSNGAFITYRNELQRVNRNLKYAVVESESDLKKFDFEGYEPIISNFNYYDRNGNYHYGTIAIIDKTNSGEVKVSAD